MVSAAEPPALLMQLRLTGLLRGELLHTLGAYRLASTELTELHSEIGGEPEDRVLLEVVDAAKDLNERLREDLHRPHQADPDRHHRHPSPFGAERELLDPELLVPIEGFYEIAGEALGLHLDATEKKWDERDHGEQLGVLLAHVHDPHRNTKTPPRSLIEGRLERVKHRRAEATQRREAEEEAHRQDLKRPGVKAKPAPTLPRKFEFDQILTERLRMDEDVEDKDRPSLPPRLHLTILEALSDAHLCMHQAEHLRSQTFGPMFTEIPETQERMERLLDRSVVLNTFVYVAARSAPWIFAEDDEERKRILEDFDGACRSLTPTYGMWIANQMGLLALERRAYTWWTLGRHDRAYRDFHKLIRLLRSLRGQVEQRAMRVRGTKTLVEGLTATAEHHIGRIYREQHAHRVALRYFDRASKHLEGWAEHPEIGGIMRNSRWRVDLLISRGKANYELGRVKTSLLYYARAWRAFLQLADSESEHTANLDLVTQAIEWLASIEDEPELSKAELSRRLEPLVGQFQTVYSPVHLRLLAAEIMMRLGHLLYILKLPPLDWDGEEFPPRPDHKLAWRCMRQAALLDPASTLIAADLLKILNSTPTADAEESQDSDKKRDLPPTVPLDEQWPSGGDRFEEAVRVVEYVVQSWLNDDPEEDDSVRANGARIARELLRSFLAHTDSSNVKLAQVYNYLMQRPREFDHVSTQPSPTIELVCLRRYSSFFPLLPRPAAFRALGGGYLVRVRDENQEPFGIAIDPGPDFLNNLFRCGYSLADVQMIVLTHDHADHSASLDSLLALLGTRQLLANPIFGGDKRLTIVGNQSVVERYRFFNDDEPIRKDENGEYEKRGDPVRVMSFEQFAAISSQRGDARKDAIEGTHEEDEKKKPKILLSPKTLQIDPVRTVDHIDAGGHVAQGFLLHLGDDEERASILFTGDTGRPPAPGPNGEEPEHYEAPGETSLAGAIEVADVVVAHLSSVPLPELRDLAGLTSGPGSDDELVGAFTDIWKMAAGNAGPSIEDETSFLLNQLQFAFRSRGKKGDRLAVSPFDAPDKMDPPSDRHLYLAGLLDIAGRMAKHSRESSRPALLLIGELREELGTFRTRIASRVSEVIFGNDSEIGTTLTTDIGLRLRVSRPPADEDRQSPVSVLCTTCDLDTDLIACERFHSPHEIREVCVKGENEGVFYNCTLHDPGKRPELPWVEAVERYNIFGD